MYKGTEVGSRKTIYGNYIMPEEYKDCIFSDKTCWIGIGDVYNTEWHQVHPETVTEVSKYGEIS